MTSSCSIWRRVMCECSEISMPLRFSTFSTFALTEFTVICSRSTLATTLTTSHRMPISMFMMVSDATKMKASSRTVLNQLSRATALTKSAMSGTMPPRSSWKQEWGTDWKYWSPIALCFVSWRKAIPNRYTMMASSTKVSSTDLVPTHMPLIKIISSGTARRSRTILAMRVSRISRSSRSAELFPKPPDDSEARAKTMDVTQVSRTARKTRTESKTNQPSWTAFLACSKAMKRTKISKTK
mmetsp:Transcript_11757/g.30165  ORF Transcript_11757/g.30165 Transcript_11757/m.30165 type:complete len:240 (-) Transcript_11757:532-1251(-)